MKKLKVLAIGLVLSLTGAVYAFSGAGNTPDSCPMKMDGSSCCKSDSSCCKGGDGACCKTKRMTKQ